MVALAAALCLAGPTARADDGSDGSDSLSAAQQALAQAEIQATQARNQVAEASSELAAARAALAQAQAQLAAIDTRITALNTEVSTDQAEVAQLTAQIQQDKQELAAFLRASYESGGSETTIEYLMDSRSIGDLVERVSEVQHVAAAGNVLVDQIDAEQEQEQQALDAAVQARTEAQAAEQQAATQEVIVEDDEASDTEELSLDRAAESQADGAVTSAQDQYDLISEDGTSYADAEAALEAARADDTIFAPVAGPAFTEDTDLTLPSGENAQTIDDFLAGTALAGLGSTYMEAEHDYGVSARYLVAHSIEESGWGTSAIAQDDNNLFGWNADDADPAGDASRFPSFAACILFVAQAVRVEYLTPEGEYYHGPTLRGMNVDYASDPFWASKIAAIAQSIPRPGS